MLVAFLLQWAQYLHKMKLVSRLEQHNYYESIRCASKDDDTEVEQ